MTNPILVLTAFDRSSGTGREQSRAIIAGYLSVPADRIHLTRTDTGKPVVRDFSGIHIGISHSRDILAVYIGSEEAGVDVEYIRARTYMDDMARIICTDTEFRLFEAAGPDTMRVFYGFWTRKEAELKKSGGTLSDLFAKHAATRSSYRFWQVSGDYMVCMASSQSTLDSLSIESRLSASVSVSSTDPFAAVSGKI